MNEQQRDDPQKPNEAVDPALVEKAVDFIRRAVKGNGARPQDVKFISFTGEVLHFEALERFEIEPRVSEKLAHGKVKGEISGSQQDVRQKIQSSMEKATHNTDVMQATIEALRVRPDRGFGLDNFLIPLDRLKQIFVVHEVCSLCNGAMKSACLTCRGAGKTQCRTCHGVREITCPVCRGRKLENTPRGPRPCTQCAARGRVRCRACNRTGFVKCSVCRAAGQIPCKNCSATGWHSRTTSLEMRAHSYFMFDRAALPHDVPPLIDTLRSTLITEGHAQAVIKEDRNRLEELSRQGKPGEYFIPYQVRLPWGTLKVSIGGHEVESKLFGFQPSIVHAPPFIEVTAKNGLRLLAEASASSHHTAARLREAVRIRAVAQAVIAATHLSRRRALDYMYEKYPFGLRRETVSNMITQAAGALKRVTRRPRQTGFVLGLAAAGAFYALYYTGILPHPPFLGSMPASVVADVVVAAAGGFIVMAMMQFLAALSIKKAIGKIMPAKAKKRLLSRAGHNALWGYGGALAVYMAVLYWVALRGGAVPHWYESLLKAVGL